MPLDVEDQQVEHEYIVVGAGPAGLQLGYFLKQRGRDFVILEADARPGAFFTRFPRHRQLISINKTYTGYDDPELNLRWDWNSLLDDSSLSLRSYTRDYYPPADVLVAYLHDYAECHDLPIAYHSSVNHIDRDDHGFRLSVDGGPEYRCKVLIVATGLTRPFVPSIPGIEYAETYSTISTNPEDYVGQRILIIGKGNSAFETADSLNEVATRIHLLSPHSLTMAWASHFVGHLRAVNNSMLDSYRLKLQNAVIDATVDGIVPEGGELAVSIRYKHAHGERETLRYDRVIACTGFRFDRSMFDRTCSPSMVISGRFPELTSSWQSANVSDLYFAGTLMQSRDFKRTSSGFIHGFRYNIRALARIFGERYHGEPLPALTINPTPEALRDRIVQRMNRTSALWQQFGFLCDAVLVDDQAKARYIEELPVDLLHESDLGRHPHYYTLTLDYGPDHATEDPFASERIDRNDVENAHLSNFLHPIIRRFAGPRLVAEHHVIEDLAAEWVEPVHTEPLLEFFVQQLRSAEEAAMR